MGELEESLQGQVLRPKERENEGKGFLSSDAPSQLQRGIHKLRVSRDTPYNPRLRGSDQRRYVKEELYEFGLQR